MDSRDKLYLECYSGISGDMTVAALLDLGADEQVMREALDSLSLPGFRVEIRRVRKSGIDACDFNVILDREHENRGLEEIKRIIGRGRMTEGARNLAVRIFEILAEAESGACNVPADQVHFHEAGAVDSIADIVAAAVCIDNLGIREVLIPLLCEGMGTIRCRHGILPVPVPAVANIVKLYGLPVRIVEAEGEFVTPTGAAIAAAVKTSETLPKDFFIEKVGIGAGKRNYESSGILRAMIIREKTGERDTIFKLEANIDDSTGETLGYAMGQLFEAGAKDVHYMPVFMKKNRPAWQLNVICSREDIQKLEHIIFRETTTIGIRRVEMERTVLGREQKTVSTPLGEAQVKACRAGELKKFYPEYDSVAKLAKDNDVPFSYVYQLVQKQCET